MKIPATLVEACLKTVPREFSLRGHTAARDLDLGPDSPPRGRPIISLDWVVDHGEKRRRAAMVSDLEAWVRLANALPNLSLVSGLYPWDVPVEAKDLRAAQAMLRFSDKPMLIAPFSAWSAGWIAKMLSAVSDRGPRAIYFCSCNSPLIFSESQLGVLLAGVEHGLPVMVNSSAVTGATAPITLAGTLVVMNAEMLAGIVIGQLARPGAPLIYAGHPIVLDMRTSIASCGHTESGLLQAALVELGRSYGLVTASNGLTTDSNVCDAQAAVEKWNTGLLGVLGGAALNGGAGSLAALSSASLEQMVIDDDIYGRMLRLGEGIQVNEETLAMDVIRSVGPNRHFLEEPHTVQHLRTEFRRSLLAERQNPEVWLRAGGRDAVEAASQRVRSILGTEAKTYLDPAGEAALAELFEAAVRSISVP